MSLTLTLLRARVAQRMDATGATRWNTTTGPTGEIDPIIANAFDREWRRILTANPYIRMSQKTPTSDASGRYLLSDLQTLTGDSQERLFRVMLVKIDGFVYEEVSLRDWAGSLTDNPLARVWWRQGDYLMALPQTASKQADMIWVSHLPTRPDAVSAVGVSCVFPEGYDEVVVLEAAADLLLKGNAESDASMNLRALANILRTDMLADLARTGSRPTRMQYSDYGSDWGASG